MHQLFNQSFVFRSLILVSLLWFLFYNCSVLWVLGDSITQKLREVFVPCLDIWRWRKWFSSMRIWNVWITPICGVTLKILEQLQILSVHFRIHIHIGKNILNIQIVIELIQLIRVKSVASWTVWLHHLISIIIYLSHLLLLLEIENLLELVLTEITKLVL